MNGARFATRKTWLRLGRILGSLVLPLAVIIAIGIVIRDSPATLRSIHLNPALLLLSFLIECSGLLIAIPVWRRILGAYGARQSLRVDVRIYCYSAVGLILPGGIWSIVSRSAHYQRLGASGLRVAVASVVETLIIGVAAIIVYALVTLIQPELALFKQPVLAYGLAALAVVLVYPDVFNRLSRWAIHRSKIAKPVIVNFRLYELLTWIGFEAVVTAVGGLAIYILLSSFSDISGQLILPVLAAWAAASAASNLLFWLPGTPLIRDGAMVAALTLVVPLPTAVLFVGVQRVWTIMSLLCLAGLVWLVMDRSTDVFKVFS